MNTRCCLGTVPNYGKWQAFSLEVRAPRGVGDLLCQLIVRNEGNFERTKSFRRFRGVNTQEQIIKQKLVETADGLFMRLGLKSVSMDDIARQMGVSKKTIYQIVGNKRDLIELVLVNDACKDLEVIQENLRESKDAIDEFLRNSRYFIRQMRAISPTTFHDLQKYYPALWREQMQAHQQDFLKSVEANMNRGMEEGLYRHDLQPGIIAKLYVAMMMIIIDKSIFPAQERPITDVIREHASYHLNGLVNQFGRERLETYLKKEALD
jgi:AcrR family transcriptional regulator